jgi:hypothetical protein
VVAWSDSPAKYQLYSIHSNNGGANWGAPVKISDAAGAENINADFPELITSNGVVNAIWRDARRNPSLRIPYTAVLVPSLKPVVFLPVIVR